MKINKDRQVGDILFIVEGAKTEFDAIESFVISCFREHSYDIRMKLGADVKHFMGKKENQEVLISR